MTQPALRLVDANGEINDCPSCRQLADENAGLTKALGDAARAIANLKRDREMEAREHDLWPFFVELGKLYNAESGRKCKFGRKRFELAEPHLKQYGREQLECLIVGIVHAPESVNGKVYDSFDTAFRDEGSVEKYSRRGWRIREARKAKPRQSSGS